MAGMRKSASAAAGLILAAAFVWRLAGLRPAPGEGAAEAAAKLRVLEDILASRNDNDPRLDRDFETLSPEAKRLFRRKYLALPPERRNERGTIAYLLGRNLASDEDWAFLREVASEPPCLSLEDCSREAPSGGHAAMGHEVTLAYPPLVALTQARRALEVDPGGRWSAQAMEVLRAGRSSKTPAVAKLAGRLSPP